MKKNISNMFDIKNKIKRIISASTSAIDTLPEVEEFPLDFSEEDIATIRAVKPYTMTSNERIFCLIQAVKYIVQNNIEGDIVECGVWKGGSMLAVARTLMQLDDTSRHLYLFDTFDGMTEPTEQDVEYSGNTAANLLAESNKEESESVWCYASFDEVKVVIENSGYNRSKIELVKGKVEDTIPINAPEKISILRLDTDWYESTRHELVHLFPRLAVGGVLIIDDYGWWKGSRLATDEYIQQNNIKILLNRIDNTGRIAIKFL